MAMGGRGQREAQNAIASCRPFRNSTGSLKGTRGSTRTLGWLESHTEARRIRELLSRAVYVVWSYNTPISWVTEGEDGERTAYYVDEQHSPTTSHHQTIARVGMGEYETIGSGPVSRRSPRGVRYGEGYRQRTEAPVQFVTDHRDVRYDARVERDTSYDRDLVSARAELASSPGFQNGTDEETQRQRMQRLLDPRYADPDWTPFSNGFHGNLPPGAEGRDAERVERENAERPWRP